MDDDTMTTYEDPDDGERIYEDSDDDELEQEGAENYQVDLVGMDFVWWEERRNLIVEQNGNVKEGAKNFLLHLSEFEGIVSEDKIRTLLQEFNNDEDIISLVNNIDIFDTSIDEASYENSRKYALEYASPELRNNKAFVTTLVERQCGNFRFASRSLRGDPDVALTALSSHDVLRVVVVVHPFNFVSDELLRHRSFMMRAVEINVKCLEYAGDAITGDLEIISHAIMQDHWAYEHASSHLKTNKQIAILAIENGHFLGYLNERFHDEEEVVSIAVQISPLAIRHATPRLRNCKPFVLNAVEKNENAFKFCSTDLRGDIDVALVAVRKNGDLLRFVSPRLRDNKQVVLEAVRGKFRAVYWASGRLKNDIDVFATHKLRRLKLPATDLLLDPGQTPISFFPSYLARRGINNSPFLIFYFLQNRFHDFFPSEEN